MRICLAGPSLFPPVGAVLVVRIILEVLKTITVLLAGLLVEQLAAGSNGSSKLGVELKRSFLLDDIYCHLLNDYSSEIMDLLTEIDYYEGMSGRVNALLAEAKTWCVQEKGRQSRLATFLGVSRQAVSVWFREHTNEHPRKQPTAEQALALAEFLKKRRAKSRGTR